MDAFEKELAKKQLEVLKSINRNINFLGRKLEMTNNILGKYGIAILPGAEPAKEEQEKPAEDEAVIRVSDIKRCIDRYYSKIAIDPLRVEEFGPGAEHMLDILEKEGFIFRKEI